MIKLLALSGKIPRETEETGRGESLFFYGAQGFMVMDFENAIFLIFALFLASLDMSISRMISLISEM